MWSTIFAFLSTFGIFLLHSGCAHSSSSTSPFVHFTYPPHHSSGAAIGYEPYPFHGLMTTWSGSIPTYTKRVKVNCTYNSETCFEPAKNISELNEFPDEYTATRRCLHPIRIQFKDALGSVFSFSTMFRATVILGSSSLSTYGGMSNYLEGFAFAILPDYNASTVGDEGGFLGLLNTTSNGDPRSHTFAVEIDTVQSPEFSDPASYHVGVDINNMTSSFWAYLLDEPQTSAVDFSKLLELQVWIDYDSSTHTLNVSTLNITGMGCIFSQRPADPRLSKQIDLSNILNEYMYVGFTSARSSSYKNTYNFSESGNPYYFGISAWAFTTAANFTSSVPDGSTSYCVCSAKFYDHTFYIHLSIWLGLLMGLSVTTCVIHLNYIRWDERRRWRFKDSDLQDGPHKFSYKELALATNNFSAKQTLGRGGFGSVYKGFLPGNKEHVAIKRVSPESKQGEREFLAEVMIIGNVRHRNLVRLQGWCHEHGELLLVYDYMPEGSVDNLLFDGQAIGEAAKLDGYVRFSWERRFKIMKDVAAALVYLHYDCEQRVIHRDVKPANVMLDAKFNARLGDFGLARSYQHSLITPDSTNVAGTLGYLAPELFHTGKQTEQTDVFSFGAFLLEVTCGRKPIYRDNCDDVVLLVDHVWDHWNKAQLLDTADPKLFGVYNVDELTKALCLGLLCSHPDPTARPSMRHALLILAGDIDIPAVPTSKPRMAFAIEQTLSSDLHTTTTLPHASAQCLERHISKEPTTISFQRVASVKDSV